VTCEAVEEPTSVCTDSSGIVEPAQHSIAWLRNRKLLVRIILSRLHSRMELHRQGKNLESTENNRAIRVTGNGDPRSKQ
jgi:hypothetical protein